MSRQHGELDVPATLVDAVRPERAALLEALRFAGDSIRCTVDELRDLWTGEAARG